MGAQGKAFVPLKFELGEAFQFDWSEEGLVVGRIYHRIQVSHMKLCASHAFWQGRQRTLCRHVGDENDSGLELPPEMILGVTRTALSC